MTIMGPQIREARRLLRKTSSWLVRQTGVDYGQVVALQHSESAGQVDSTILRSVRRALEAAGVEFVREDDGAPGVRLRKGET